MLTIYKYPLHASVTTLELPEGAEILTVRFQSSPHGVGVHLWALVDPEKVRNFTRTFYIATTGSVLPFTDSIYIGTVENGIGSIFHVFEIHPVKLCTP